MKCTNIFKIKLHLCHFIFHLRWVLLYSDNYLDFIDCSLITRLCECGCLYHLGHCIDTVIVTVLSGCVCLCVHAYVVVFTVGNMQQHGERLIWKVMYVDGQATAVKLDPEC